MGEKESVPSLPQEVIGTGVGVSHSYTNYLG